MYEIPPMELLKSVHTFPGPYVFKVIGKADAGFLGRVVAGVREALGHDVDPPCETRTSSGGRHLSVTLTPTVADPEQILAVYRRLKTIEGVEMLF